MSDKNSNNRIFGGIKMSDRAADTIVAVTAAVLFGFILIAILISV